MKGLTEGAWIINLSLGLDHDFISGSGNTMNETDFVYVSNVNDPESFFYKRKPPALLTAFGLGPEWTKVDPNKYRFDGVIAYVYNGIVTMFEDVDSFLRYDSTDDTVYDITGDRYRVCPDQKKYDVIRRLYESGN